MAEIDKKKAEEELEEKKKEKPPFWQNLSPGVLIIGGILLFLAIKSMTISGGNQQFIIVIIVLVVLYLMSQTQKDESDIVTPKEAELLVERECERKIRWGQFPLMSKYEVGPVSDLAHRDARGLYYNVAVKFTNPYILPKYFVGKVMATGKEKRFTTLIKSIGPLSGRKITQEVDGIRMPEWAKRPQKYPFLEKMWGFGR